MNQSITIQPLNPTHASAVAAIHLASQEGTFLTSLGQEFLTLLYSQISQSVYGISYVALCNSAVIGFIVGATQTDALFKEVIVKRPLRFSWLITKQALFRPAVFWQALKTLTYPKHITVGEPSAELLALAIEPGWRNQKIGQVLCQQLAQDIKNLNLNLLCVTVDGQNKGALRFYKRNGFIHASDFEMYGRPMVQLSLTISESILTSCLPVTAPVQLNDESSPQS